MLDKPYSPSSHLFLIACASGTNRRNVVSIPKKYSAFKNELSFGGRQSNVSMTIVILGMLDHLTFLKDGLKLLFLYALFRFMK